MTHESEELIRVGLFSQSGMHNLNVGILTVTNIASSQIYTVKWPALYFEKLSNISL